MVFPARQCLLCKRLDPAELSTAKSVVLYANQRLHSGPADVKVSSGPGNEAGLTAKIADKCTENTARLWTLAVASGLRLSYTDTRFQGLGLQGRET